MNKNKIIKKVLSKVKDLLPGGLGDGKPDKDFDLKQLQKGIQIEREHTDNPDIAKEIAKDHLTEVSNYYLDSSGNSRLDELETEAEKELKDKK